MSLVVSPPAPNPTVPDAERSFYDLLSAHFDARVFDLRYVPHALPKHPSQSQWHLSASVCALLEHATALDGRLLDSPDAGTFVFEAQRALVHLLPYQLPTLATSALKRFGCVQQHLDVPKILQLLCLDDDTLVRYADAYTEFVALLKHFNLTPPQEGALSLNPALTHLVQQALNQHPHAPWLWWFSLTPWRTALLHTVYTLGYQMSAHTRVHAWPFYFLTDAPYLMAPKHYLPSVLCLLDAQCARKPFEYFAPFGTPMDAYYLHPLVGHITPSVLHDTLQRYGVLTGQPHIDQHFTEQLAFILSPHLCGCPLSTVVDACLHEFTPLWRRTRIYASHQSSAFFEHLHQCFDMDLPTDKNAQLMVPKGAQYLCAHLPLFTPHFTGSMAQLHIHDQHTEQACTHVHVGDDLTTRVYLIVGFDARFPTDEARGSHLHSCVLYQLFEHPFYQQQFAADPHNTSTQSPTTPFLLSGLTHSFRYAPAHHWLYLLYFCKNINTPVEYNMTLWQHLVYPISEQGSEGPFLPVGAQELHLLIHFGAHLEQPFFEFRTKQPLPLMDLMRSVLDSYRFSESAPTLQQAVAYYDSFTQHRRLEQALGSAGARKALYYAL